MSNWRCEICGNRFSNFYAQVLDDKIYCPLCYFKKLSINYKQRIDKAIEYINIYRTTICASEEGNMTEYYDCLETEEIDKLLSILKGEDKE